MTYRNPALTELARDKPCMMQLRRVCNGNRETVVWAHLRGLAHGKGMAEKPPDSRGGFACSACHDVYDGRAQTAFYTRDELREAGLLMCIRTWSFLVEEGYVVLAKPKK